jgi:hypothetical protein
MYSTLITMDYIDLKKNKNATFELRAAKTIFHPLSCANEI